MAYLASILSTLIVVAISFGIASIPRRQWRRWLMAALLLVPVLIDLVVYLRVTSAPSSPDGHNMTGFLYVLLAGIWLNWTWWILVGFAARWLVTRLGRRSA